MSIKFKSTLAAAVLLALGASVSAEDRPQRGEGPRHERGPVVIAEARERAAEHAAAMDSDGDGFISVDERKAFHEARRTERLQRMMARRGIDADATVSVEDFVERRIAWLEGLDTNGDGTVDAEEMRAGRGKHGRHRGMKGKGEGKRDPRGE